MSHPDCPTCGAAVVKLDWNCDTRTYRDRGGFDMTIPTEPVEYTFAPCGHTIRDGESVPAYTAARRATRNSDNLTP